MLGIRTARAGAISLYDHAISVGLETSAIYAIDDGDHYSAVDPSNTDSIAHIVGFIGSLH
jgi:hypothetical protein